MTTNPLSFHELEDLYDALAQAIDSCGPEREAVFLAKLALRLAHELGDGARFTTLVAECLAEPEAAAGVRLV